MPDLIKNRRDPIAGPLSRHPHPDHLSIQNRGESLLTYVPFPSRLPVSPRPLPPLLQRSEKLIIAEPLNNLWDQWLGVTRHDLFHTAVYHAVEAKADSSVAYIAVYGTQEKFLALPYLLKPVFSCDGTADPSLKEVTSVYGYSGPLACNCESDVDFRHQAWRAITRGWADQGAVSAFIRFHPIVGNASWSDAGCATMPNGAGPEGNIALLGKTVAIDLSAKADQIWFGYSRQIRQAVRKCAQSGLLVSEDRDWIYLEEFVAIYHKTMKRNNAGNFYFFSAEHLRSLKNAVGPHATLMAACDKGKLVSAAILFEYNGIVNLFLLATDDDYLELSPSKAVIHASQEWAKARGNRIFHLGGGRRGQSDDTLFQFKAAFSDRFFDFNVGRWILNQAAYDFLTEQRTNEASQFADKKIDPTYFPAYRAPLL